MAFLELQKDKQIIFLNTYQIREISIYEGEELKISINTIDGIGYTFKKVPDNFKCLEEFKTVLRTI